ncbi:MAG TPA: transglutaminaseTgpA domain-containing protein [Pyrinomonadaceae bacterium]|nr:transglutaminaseTgpA domain-containing protein [Pyrinomonadaceae bacterium]
MQFSSYFRIASYTTIGSSVLALFVAGGAGGWLIATFALVMLVAFNLEGTRWQFSERIALAVILSSIPVFYFDWRVLTPYLDLQYLEAGQHGNAEVALLSHLILFLSAVKLLQRKLDRDWFFLYLISFFTVLLAAGLTAAPLFLAVLMVYLLCALSTVVAFEIQKARRKVAATQTRLLVPPDNNLFRKLPMRLWRRKYLETRRLPLVSFGLLMLIVGLALPFFLIVPRTASSALKRGGKGISGLIGFSDNVVLGQIGELKASDEIFMHVRIDSLGSARPADLRWRGVALDEFNGKGWKRSTTAGRAQRRDSDSGFFKLGTAADPTQLTAQTFIVEAVDTPVIFAAPRAVALQAELRTINVDSEGAIQAGFHADQRLVYKAFSDVAPPAVNLLRADRMQYLAESARYLELPNKLDPRIGTLTRDVILQGGAANWYDAVRLVESHLREKYGYTLEMKAGGADPLADFLFNVKQGHCEYFATAMAVMLRTQGIATRVVNGFLPGEYNQAAGAFTVRQSDAHSWVEVYFPYSKTWVTFDPTPPAGRTTRERTGLAGALSKYSEALELLWFQYVVGYDKDEQRSLVTSVRKSLFEFQRGSFNKLEQARAALPRLMGPIVIGAGSLFGLLGLVFLTRRVRRLGWQRGLRVWRTAEDDQATRVDFYNRLVKALEKHGARREAYQTPLEFASAFGSVDAATITNVYNRVRYGNAQLTAVERSEIETALARLEKGTKD